MFATVFADSSSLIEHLADIPECQEILLECRELAFEGQISVQELLSLTDTVYAHGMRPVLVWDILMCEEQARSLCELVATLDMSVFSAVRVRDLGAAQFLRETFPELPLQLLVEADNHNLDGLLAWCEYFGDSLQRLILSIELPEAKLLEYCQKIPVACEILGAGRIEIFYTPRGLLSKHFTSSTDWIEVTAASADSGQRPFPIVETTHGTKMYLDKDQYVLDKLQALQAAGLAAVRVDIKHLDVKRQRQGEASIEEIEALSLAKHLSQLTSGEVVSEQSYRKIWPGKTLAPFFKTNKTTARFSKLKSPLHVMRDESCLAQLLYGEKDNFLVFYSLRDFDVASLRSLVLTTGEALNVSELSCLGTNGESLSHVETNRVFTTPWVRKASSGALLTCK